MTDKNKLFMAVMIAIVIAGLTQNLILGALAAYIIFNLGSKVKNMKRKKIIDLKNKGIIWNVIILALALIVFIYTFRPWFHDFFMVFYRLPLLLISIIGILGGSFAISVNKKQIAGVLFVIGFLSIITVSFNEIIMQNYIVSEQEYNQIDELPDSNNLRLLPMKVAHRYFQDSLQKSTQKIGPLDIVNLNGNLTWTAPLVPDGTVLYFTQKVKGIMTTSAKESRRNAELVNQELKVGERIGIFDNIYWHIFKKRFFYDVGEIYYLKDSKEEVITVASLIGYKFRFPVMVPYFAGAIKITPSGEKIYVSAEDVKKDPLFMNNMVFPDSLARLYVDSYKYYKGVINKWFLHEDQIEIADVYGESNRQPFLMPTEKGLKWVIATEPYGTSFGVFKIFMVDTLTGKIDMLEMNESQTLTGPVRVISYVKQEFPVIDWATSRVIEPRPYVVDNKLFWMLSITPIDYAGVSYTVFVDSETNDVLPFRTEENVRRFVRGQAVNVTDTAEEKEPSIDLAKRTIDEIEEKLGRLKELVANISS